MNTAVHSHKQHRAKVLRLVKGGRVAHGGTPSAVIAVGVRARAHVVPHADAKKIHTVLVAGLSSARVGSGGVGVDEEPGDGDESAPHLQAGVQA